MNTWSRTRAEEVRKEAAELSEGPGSSMREEVVEVGGKEKGQGFSKGSGKNVNAGGSGTQASYPLSAFGGWGTPRLSLVQGVGSNHSRAQCLGMRQYAETTASGAAF